jgi:hypothetical protein
MTRRRQPRNPELLLGLAKAAADACPTARNRRRLLNARQAFAARQLGRS